MNENIESILAMLDGFRMSDEMTYSAYSTLYDEISLLDDFLKAQESRLIVKDDFVNTDKYGYLPVYVENKDGDMYWDCITDAALGDTFLRFWTVKPTDEQRKMVKWNEP